MIDQCKPGRNAAAVVVLLASAACTGVIGDGAGEQVSAEALLSAPSSVRRLTSHEYDNTLEDLLDDGARSSALLLPSDLQNPFDNDYTTQQVSQALVEGVEKLAEEASARLLADPSRRDAVVGCTPTGPGDAPCLRSFVARFGRLALRGALDGDEIERFVTTAVAVAVEEADFYAGVDVALRALLQDPRFLYRIEIGVPVGGQPGLYRLRGTEVAQRLSYLLWGSMPDDWLLDLGEAGALETSELVAAAARLALEHPHARRQTQRFHALWLGYDSLPHDPELGSAMRAETDALVERVIFEARLPWHDIFRFGETFVDDTLAAHYGLPPPGSGEPVWTPYGSSGRRGILSHGTFLSNGAKLSDTSPTLRGLAVRTRLFCQEILPPPPGVATDEPIPATEDAVCKVDRYASHAQGGCAGCHSQMDPVGFGLENYDAQGRYRSSEPGLPECVIDGQGELAGIGSFEGPAGLAELMLGTAEFRRCAVAQLERFAIGREGLEQADEERVDAALAGLGADYRFDELVLALVTHDAFRFRREED